MFKYICDPLCIIGWIAYIGNKWILDFFHFQKIKFFDSYFNDFFLIPCVLPPLLLIHRLISLRKSDKFPTLKEVIYHLVIWSIWFEGLGPIFFKQAVSDIWDIVAYWSGGIISWMIWNKYTILSKIRKLLF